MKPNRRSDFVVALDRIVVSDESGPVANASKHGSAYRYIAAEKGDVARVLSISGDNLLCGFERTRLAVEVPATSVVPYEA